MTVEKIITNLGNLLECEGMSRDFCELRDCSECEYYVLPSERIDTLKGALEEVNNTKIKSLLRKCKRG